MASLILAVCLMIVFPQFDCKLCSKTNAEQCAASLMGGKDQQIMALPEPEIQEYCRLYYKHSDCMSELYDGCDKEHQLIFDGTNAAFHYLCNETLQEYLQYQECFTRANLHRKLDRCLNNFLTNVASIDVHSSSALEQLCGDVDSLIKCDAKATTSACGPDAGKWEKEFVRVYYEPTKKHIGCNSGGTRFLTYHHTTMTARNLAANMADQAPGKATARYFAANIADQDQGSSVSGLRIYHAFYMLIVLPIVICVRLCICMHRDKGAKHQRLENEQELAEDTTGEPDTARDPPSYIP